MDAIHELLLTDAAIEKLAKHAVSGDEALQLIRNAHVTARNPRGSNEATRRLLVGMTDGGRILTLVVEETLEPTSWLVVTGWESTETERNLLGN